MHYLISTCILHLLNPIILAGQTDQSLIKQCKGSGEPYISAVSQEPLLFADTYVAWT